MRLDKYLKVSRLIKRRTVANEVADAGRILINGKTAKASQAVKAGDIIESIDGERIKAGESWFGLLRNKTGKKVCVVVRQDKKEVELFVEPTYSESKLMYLRWVKQREDMTDRLSGGKVGYSHVQGMDSPSFRTVYSKLLGKYRAADAAVVDTRHNGGGWLHDDLATFLSGKEYVRYTPRGQYIGSDPYNKWRKPSCVLMCEDNYSDASGFPYTYRTLGIGKLIGMPVPGTMTAVWWETQLNGMVFGIPQVGSLGTKEGRWLENMQIEPDIKVDNDPASVLRGEDKQLEAAVEEMLKTK
jgi:C-terminal processing protease CtpA/Prc